MKEPRPLIEFPYGIFIVDRRCFFLFNFYIKEPAAEPSNGLVDVGFFIYFYFLSIDFISLLLRRRILYRRIRLRSGPTMRNSKMRAYISITDVDDVYIYIYIYISIKERDRETWWAKKKRTDNSNKNKMAMDRRRHVLASAGNESVNLFSLSLDIALWKEGLSLSSTVKRCVDIKEAATGR